MAYLSYDELADLSALARKMREVARKRGDKLLADAASLVAATADIERDARVGGA